MPATVVRSYSKINLGLRIGPPRADGFHSLTTLYQTVALYDRVTVEAECASAVEITMSASDPRVPTDGRNTAYKMVSAALMEMGVAARVHLHLEKRLPPQGGMGAGSANAVASLLGLERQLRAAGVGTLDGAARLRIAERVGSDVPLFLIGGTVYGHDRGQLVMPYPDLPEMPCLIVAPLQGSSTPAAFRAWDESIARLTPEAAGGRLDELSRVYASIRASIRASLWGPNGASAFLPAGQELSGNLPGLSTGTLGVSGGNDSHADGDLAGNAISELVRTGIENDFEAVVFQQHPSLRAIKDAMTGLDASLPEDAPRLAMLSGSGSSIFGLFRTGAEAEAAERRVQALGTGARTFVSSTIGRERYWRTMFEQ